MTFFLECIPPPPPSTVTCFKVRYSVYQIALPFLCFLHSFCMSQVSVFLLELTPFVSSVCRLCPNRYQHVLKAPYPSKMSVSTPYVEVRGNLHPKWHPIRIHPLIIWTLVDLMNVSWWALIPTLATTTEQRFLGTWKRCKEKKWQSNNDKYFSRVWIHTPFPNI